MSGKTPALRHKNGGSDTSNFVDLQVPRFVVTNGLFDDPFRGTSSVPGNYYYPGHQRYKNCEHSQTSSKPSSQFSSFYRLHYSGFAGDTHTEAREKHIVHYRNELLFILLNNNERYPHFLVINLLPIRPTMRRMPTYLAFYPTLAAIPLLAQYNFIVDIFGQFG